MISYQQSIKIRTPYGGNTDIQSLRAGFFQRGSNITALANCHQIAVNCRHVIVSCGKLPLRDQKIVYNFERCFRSSCFLSLALDPRLQTIQSYRLARPSCHARASIDRVANTTALIQQILTSRRSVGFFTDYYQAVFCGLGFIIFLSSYSIFRKLSLRSIYLVQHLILLAILYSYIGPKFPMGSSTSFLLTFLISSAGSIIQVVWGRRSIQTRYGLSYISFLKAWSLRIASAQ